MSLRWELFGFNLDTLRSLLGSGDESVVDRLGRRLDERLDAAVKEGWSGEELGEQHSRVKAIIQQAIIQGVPFPLLRREDADHVAAADAIAREGQTLFPIQGSSYWKHGAWYAFEEAVAAALTESDQQLLHWLVCGRPLFGLAPNDDWVCYAYFSHAELSALVEALGKAVENVALPPAAGTRERSFAGELLGWLNDITSRGLDLWVVTE